MAKATPIQTQFNGGELSPLVRGRVDLDQYYNGLDTCLNFIPTVQGPLARRPGTGFVAQAHDTATASRVLPFQFSTAQAYVIEMGNQIARFYTDHASLLESTVAVSAATVADPVVVTTGAAHGYSDGDEVFVTGVTGMTEINDRRFLVSNKTSTTFELQDLDGNDIDGTGYTAFSAGGTVARVATLATPYAAADLAGIKFAQSADVLYLAHKSYAPRKLQRTSATTFTISEIDFADGPFGEVNATTETLTPSGTTGSITLTLSDASAVNGGSGFVSTDVGRLVRFKDSAGNWTWLEITARNSATEVDATIRGADLATTDPTTSWRLGLWSDTTGWPQCVTGFESRLWWGGGVDTPQTIVASRSGDFEAMAPSDPDGTVAADHSIVLTLDANQVNAVRWLSDDEKGLLAGTSGGIWIVRASTAGEALAPATATAKRPIAVNSADIQALKASDATLFIEGARKMREMAFVLAVDGFRAPDISIVSEHITRSGVTEIAHTRRPQSIVWAVRGDGTLLGMTYERDQEVVAWHRHTLGGASDAQGTAAIVESIAAIPVDDGEFEELWCVVRRHVNGQTRRYVEYLHQMFEEDDALEDSRHLDSMLTYDGAAASTIGGLWHLVGETVSILADGGVVADRVVASDGTIDLGRDASVVHVGYGYTSQLRTMSLEAGAADGTAQGKRKRINRVVCRVLSSLGGKIGPRVDRLDKDIYQVAGSLLGEAPALYSGDRAFSWDSGYDDGAHVVIQQDQPLPLCLLAIIPQVTTQDR